MTTTRSAAALQTPAVAESDVKREFLFSDADFRKLADYAYQHTGISLSDSKRDLIYNRLSRRLRALGLRTFKEYHEYLEGPEGGAEKERFINSVSTNHTRFFREAHHFTHFRTYVAAHFARTHGNSSGARLRVWSAGCSTGEEPYTIAMVLRSEISTIARHDVRILATDIDTEVLSRGARGEYPTSARQEIPSEYHGYLDRKSGSKTGDKCLMPDELRSLITYRQLNLMENWPVKGPFDAIFCRNVMIYFDAQTKKTLVERFTRLIRPGGWLYIGHSESLIGAHPGLELVGRTIYRREG